MLGQNIVHEERRDSGGMFDDRLAVEALPDGRFRAFVETGFGGGIQCFRSTFDEAKAELNRLHNKLHGYEDD